MRASRIHLQLAMLLTLGFSGCYGYCGGYPSPYGYGGAYDCGYGPYGYPDYYGGYGLDPFGDPYGDCVGGDWGYYGDEGLYGKHARDRLTLRERLRGRRDARHARRDGRGRRHGHHGDSGDCCCCCDSCWEMDCCGGCGFDCCSPCGDCCGSFDSCCGDSGPWMDGSSGWQTMPGPGCQTCNAGPAHDGAPTCAGGSCSIGSQWGNSPPTYVPYSHESYPTEAAPNRLNSPGDESLPVPPAQQDVPEGKFNPATDDTSVIRSPQAAIPGVRQTDWVPPRF